MEDAVGYVLSVVIAAWLILLVAVIVQHIVAIATNKKSIMVRALRYNTSNALLEFLQIMFLTCWVLPSGVLIVLIAPRKYSNKLCSKGEQ